MGRYWFMWSHQGQGVPLREADQVGYQAQSVVDLKNGKAFPSEQSRSPPSTGKVFGQTLVKLCAGTTQRLLRESTAADGPPPLASNLLEKALPRPVTSSRQSAEQALP